jgi:uncharacterized protein involved in response to NO
MLAAAPHRLLFFVGACNVLAAMAWWTLWLVAVRWPWLAMPQPPIPAGWAHAIMLPFQVLAPFIFGFLLTVFPRWMNLPSLSRWHYLPVGLGLLGGQLMTLVGLWGFPHLVHLGLLFTLAGWTAGLSFLFGVLWREEGRTWHAVSCIVALGLGWVGLAAFVLWMHTQEPRLAFAAIKLGMLGFALPIYFTVCHRMLPFFASCALPGYRAWRPMGLLAAFWALLLLHLGLELAHLYAWLWLADLPLMALTGLMLWRWWPRQRAPGLLMVLFIGFAWLPLAFALFSAQSLWLAATEQFVLGRAPVHALAIGFFGSLLVAMVTRVTQGHSGRPLAMHPTAWFAFALIQLVALTRVAAEFGADGWAWQAIAAAGWLLAFLPWVLRSAWIYLTPRRDGQPG